MVSHGGISNCHGGDVNYHGVDLNYHGGISSLPTQPPDTHRKGRRPSAASPQRGTRPPAAASFVDTLMDGCLEAG